MGRRGYTIRKADMSEAEHYEVRSTLTVKPVVPKMVQAPSPFPVYLESVQKMYVPLYWGIERFGYPATYEISRGDDVVLEFRGAMREYQGPSWPSTCGASENEASGLPFGGGSST